MLSDVFEHAVAEQRAPPSIKGGVHHSLHKKGDRDVKDNYRGIIAESAFGKLYAELVAEAVGPAYANDMPDAQSGCVKG